MKRNMLIILVLLLIAFFVAGSEAEKDVKQSGQLTVIIVGLENDEGKVKVGLFDSKDNYTGDGGPFRGASVVIKDRKAECTFEGIPYWTYAIKLYHDKNGNGKLDTNFLGMPKELYGFSNNVRGKFGPPQWDDAKFVFKANSMSIEITVK
jgi:uncharacterized protein (DUF2141 family)